MTPKLIKNKCGWSLEYTDHALKKKVTVYITVNGELRRAMIGNARIIIKGGPTSLSGSDPVNIDDDVVGIHADSKSAMSLALCRAVVEFLLKLVELA